MVRGGNQIMTNVVNIEKYISDRVKSQIDWHDNKSKTSKRLFVTFGIVQVTAVASIPIINSFASADLRFLYVSSILAGIAAVATGFVVFLRAEENWLRYRNTCNRLESLLVAYEHHMEPFDQKDRDALFVTMCESALGEEQSRWLEEARQKQGKLTGLR